MLRLGSAVQHFTCGAVKCRQFQTVWKTHVLNCSTSVLAYGLRMSRTWQRTSGAGALCTCREQPEIFRTPHPLFSILSFFFTPCIYHHFFFLTFLIPLPLPSSISFTSGHSTQMSSKDFIIIEYVKVHMHLCYRLMQCVGSLYKLYGLIWSFQMLLNLPKFYDEVWESRYGSRMVSKFIPHRSTHSKVLNLPHNWRRHWNIHLQWGDLFLKKINILLFF